ncbi:MAG: 2-amino-4-hydroxy-6-hydroxymethyldihydropteridine diphosphokinase [Rhodobacteraceae bacterium]|nr:2-amino-4-hydroxy-6-hydroxymethyldihydropteridine diphosphokinase [Paracoccaceae bacterium]
MAQELNRETAIRTAAIGLGANLPSPAGDARSTLAAGLRDLAGGFRIAGVSRFFRSPAFPPGSGPDFVNAAVLVDTDMAPECILRALHAIEARYLRERKSRWAARTLDLDLLFVGDCVLPNRDIQVKWMHLLPERQQIDCPESLILPHPRLQDRAFVLVPLAEIAPRWRHPVTGHSVSAMTAGLPDAEKAAICPV